MITAADLKTFAPKARKDYVSCLLSNTELLREAGLFESPYRLCHFMAQCAHETGGFTIVRESLHYTSVKRLREVWPARFRNKTDDELKPLVKNAIALGDAVYMGRMGNTMPGDGYAYRGAGFLQTTGKSAVEAYAKACAVTPSPALLDDLTMTLRFACHEWQESGCCEYADENDLTKVSKAINVGSATSNVKPVGFADRQKWFARAWAVWGDKGKADKPVSTSDVVDAVKSAAVKYGVPVAGAAGAGGAAATKTTEAPKPEAKPKPTAKETLAKAQETKALVEQAKDLGIAAQGLGKWAMGDGLLISISIALVAGVVLVFPKIKERLS